MVVGKTDLENVSHSERWNLKGAFNTLAADDKYPVQDCEYL